jgi:hypothetical protein
MKLEDLKISIKTYLSDKMLLKYASAETAWKQANPPYIIWKVIFLEIIFLGLVRHQNQQKHLF